MSLLIDNAVICPIDGPDATWMLVEGTHIKAIGRGELPPHETRLDLGGRSVFPGFIDSHVHMLFTGLGLQALPLQGANSPFEVRDHLRSAPPGPWIRGFGFDDANFTEPLTWDGFPEDRPCIVERIDHHSALVNRKAAELLAAEGVQVQADGRVAGKAFARTLARVYRDLDEETKVAALRSAAQTALRRGVTTVHALEGGHGFSHRDLELAVEHSENFGPRMLVYPQVVEVDYVRSLGLSRLGGCLLLDGSFGSRTASLLEPYADAPDTQGLRYFSDASLAAIMQKAHAADMQLSFHAIGDGAVAQAVRCYQTLGDTRGRRHRIEHCELARPEDLESIAAMELHLGIQPQFEASWGGPGRMYERRLGAKRAARTNPLAWYRRHGIACGGGSDSDVTPLDPLLGIQAAMMHPRPEERLTIQEALELFTIGAARLGFDEGRVGTLTAGKQADFVVLADDPRAVASNRIARIDVLQVWVAGHRLV